MSVDIETWKFHNCSSSCWLNLVTVLNYQNVEFQQRLANQFDQFGLCADENLGVACACQDVGGWKKLIRSDGASVLERMCLDFVLSLGFLKELVD